MVLNTLNRPKQNVSSHLNKSNLHFALVLFCLSLALLQTELDSVWSHYHYKSQHIQHPKHILASPFFYVMKVECLQEAMRSLSRKTTLPSICFTLILEHLVQKIHYNNNNNNLNSCLVLYKTLFYMESYKSSTT